MSLCSCGTPLWSMGNFIASSQFVWINIVFLFLPLLSAFVLSCHDCCVAFCLTIFITYFSHLLSACLTCSSVYPSSSSHLACPPSFVSYKWLVCIWFNICVPLPPNLSVFIYCASGNSVCLVVLFESYVLSYAHYILLT